MSAQFTVVGSGDVDFRFLETRFGGPAGARDAFERLVADVVGIIHPDVQEVEANPGDWGIDAYVGDLGQGGEIHVWQSKYFINGVQQTQQGDIRDSYKSARKAASVHGYTIKSWTLCVPCELDAPMQQWWNGWKKRTSNADGLAIDIETAGKLRRRLQSPAGEHVRNHYFSPIFPAIPDAGAARALEMLDDESKYNGALFVRQMHEAGMPETFAAREAFFNAEILEREVNDKSVRAEVTALANWRVKIASTWSIAFNTACQKSSERRFPELFGNVAGNIEASHERDAADLGAHPVHGIGLLHQVVDNGRAGWVRDWRQVAEDHYSHSVSKTPGTRFDGAPMEAR